MQIRLLFISVFFIYLFQTVNGQGLELPIGKEGPEADSMAQKMLRAINYEAWQATDIVEWSFKAYMDVEGDRKMIRKPRHFIWDRQRNYCQVTWGDGEKVLLDLNQVEGIAFKNGEKISNADSLKDRIQKAWAYWCNDSFWLNAPAKVYDEGTTRSVVTLEDGRKGLKVTYDSGGVTPGDSYVWILDESGLPTSYLMWVSIFPVGGIEVSWKDYKKTQSGALIARTHDGDLGLEVPIFNVEVEDKLRDLTDDDIFAPMLK